MGSPDHQPVIRHARFRFYQELNDFLAVALRQKTFGFEFTGQPSVKDSIEAIGVPHTEVDLILVDGVSVAFDRQLVGGERIAVFPVFERFDIAQLTRLRPKPLRDSRFILDVHLGKLARSLRLLGFDTCYRNDLEDREIVRLARAQKRIILTRDKGILKYNEVTHGYWVRNIDPDKQLAEISSAFDLPGSCKPFTRCICCNGRLFSVTTDRVIGKVPAQVIRDFSDFSSCRECSHIYWKGSHYVLLLQKVKRILGDSSDPLSLY